MRNKALERLWKGLGFGIGRRRKLWERLTVGQKEVVVLNWGEKNALGEFGEKELEFGTEAGEFKAWKKVGGGGNLKF